ncbi:MAG: flagellar basal body-associated FliL family protein [Lachnospiraceae bacterium]
MKKNLFSIIVIVLLLINLICTIVLTIGVLPQAKNANRLIERVAAAIDLEINDSTTETTETISIDQITTYDVNGGEALVINLKKSDDGSSHYASVEVSLSMNIEHEDYSTYGETLSTKESLIKSQINSVISGHTYDEFTTNQAGIQQEILTALQTMFDSNFIIGVDFPSAIAE